MKAKFTYFKTTGKYYSEGYGTVPDDFAIKHYSKIQLVNFNNGFAPGLSGFGFDFIWLVEEDSGVPRLMIDSE